MDSGKTKIAQTVEFLKEKGLDGLVIYSSGAFHFLQPNRLQYFAQWRPMGPNNAVVVSKSGEVALLVQPAWDVARASQQSWIKDTRPTADFLGDLASVLREFKIVNSVGVAGFNEVKNDFYQAVSMIASIVPADDISESIARKKTPLEVEIAKKTGEIADVGYEAFVEYSRIGIREYELVAEMEYAMRMAGAQDNFTLLSSGKHNYAMHSPSNRRLAAGDIIIGEISPVYQGQVIQICRTVVLGEASPLLTEKYDMLVRALKESKKEIKPGQPAAGMSIAMNKVITEAGYGKYCHPPYMRARGHGFSLGSIAPGGVLDDQTEEPFQKDQVVVVHPNQYLPETGYLVCGESVLVSDSGNESLLKTETKLYAKEV